MARYSSLVGHRVGVHCRAVDIVLRASGTFVADSGRSIFLEQSFVQRGQQKHFRWEIPYQYIVRLDEKPEGEEGDSGNAKGSALRAEQNDQVSRASASSSVDTTTRLPLPNRPTTA